MILYLVSQLVLTVMLDLYIVMRLRELGELKLKIYHDGSVRDLECYRDIRKDILDLKKDISLLSAKQGVESSAFGLINATTDFNEIEKPTVRKTRTAEQREKAAQKRREWWAKKKEEQNAPPQIG